MILEQEPERPSSLARRPGKDLRARIAGRTL
jgi:hypothetical protein